VISQLSGDTVLVLGTTVHLYSYTRYKLQHTGKVDVSTAKWMHPLPTSHLRIRPRNGGRNVESIQCASENFRRGGWQPGPSQQMARDEQVRIYMYVHQGGSFFPDTTGFLNVLHNHDQETKHFYTYKHSCWRTSRSK